MNDMIEQTALAARAADKAHRARINGEALAALVTVGLDEVTAKSVVIAIARGEVPHISISY